MGSITIKIESFLLDTHGSDTMIKHGVLHSYSSVVSLVQRLIDLVIITCSLWVVHLLQQHEWTLKSSFSLLSVLVVFLLFAETGSLYRSWRGVGLAAEVQHAVATWGVSCLVISTVDFYVARIPVLSSGIILEWFLVTLTFLVVFRVSLRLVIGAFRSKGYNQRVAAIVGVNTVALHLAEQLNLSPWLGIRVAGFYDDIEQGEFLIGNLKLKVLGELEQLVNDARGGKIDRVYIALSMKNEKRIRYLVSELSDTTCSVLLVPDVFTFNLLHSRSLEVNGIPLISIFDTPMVGLNAFIKRIEDVFLASVILFLISPALSVIAIAVKLTSAGPVIFKQKRYGIDGKSIEVWKFRSMTVMEDGAKVTQATQNDARLTPIGSFLRRTSLDELPQFINVLKGDMSIVGPRPHAVAHNEEYRKLIKGYMLRHKVKPGITGWAQVNGWRGETDTLDKMAKRVEFDLEYIRSWSLWLDLKIVFFTIFKGFINKNAY